MSLQSRPPVVTIMGHVDHGKTSLLDAIRSSHVAAKEAGGITQHIGAYQIIHNGRPITFIDTPGHAAFSKMRSRGATVTDIVVLVVAADDGVQPQTIESIEHIKKANVTCIVAINKMDVPNANPTLVKSQLAEHEIFVEGYGGNVSAVEVSAKTKKGIDELLEMILLTADVAEISADPQAPFEGVVIESGKDSRRGVVATVLVKQGTLTPKSLLFASDAVGKVRSMTDSLGKIIATAPPSFPVEVLGFETVPSVGSYVMSKQFEEKPAEVIKQSAEAQGEKLNIILKADVAGSLEAIRQNLSTHVAVLSFGVGEVNESDVLSAVSMNCRIIAFNVSVPKSVQALALTHGVKIKTYRIIYNLFDDIEKLVEIMLNPTLDEEEIGTAEIVAQFDIRGEKIAGCKVKTGEIKRGMNILYHLKHNGVVVLDPKIKSLKNGKLDVESVKAPGECGIVFRSNPEFSLGDMIVCYTKKEL